MRRVGSYRAWIGRIWVCAAGMTKDAAPPSGQRDGPVTEAKKRSRGNKRSALHLLPTTQMTDRPLDWAHTCHVARQNATCGQKWRKTCVLGSDLHTTSAYGLPHHNGAAAHNP